jgi:hypothetical protein
VGAKSPTLPGNFRQPGARLKRGLLLSIPANTRRAVLAYCTGQEDEYENETPNKKLLAGMPRVQGERTPPGWWIAVRANRLMAANLAENDLVSLISCESKCT